MGKYNLGIGIVHRGPTNDKPGDPIPVKISATLVKRSRRSSMTSSRLIPQLLCKARA
jgi:hypothetical protein